MGSLHLAGCCDRPRPPPTSIPANRRAAGSLRLQRRQTSSSSTQPQSKRERQRSWIPRAENGGIVRFGPRLRRYKLPRTLLSPLTWSHASIGLPRSRGLATLDHDTPRSLSVLASGVTCWRFSSRSVAAATARVAPSVDGHAVRAVDPSSAARSLAVPLARLKRWPATTQHDVLPGAA